MITLPELKEWLVKTYDECDLLDALELSNEDIVDTFTDRINDRFDYLSREMELYKDEEDSEEENSQD